MKKFVLIIACILSVSGLFATTTKVSEKGNITTYKVTEIEGCKDATVMVFNCDDLTTIAVCTSQFGNPSFMEYRCNSIPSAYNEFEKLAIMNGNCLAIFEDGAVLLIYRDGCNCDVYVWNY